jgi:PGDYG protein
MSFENLGSEQQQKSTFIERKSPEIILAIQTASVYKKQGQVKARLALEGEEVETIMASGHKETSNVAKAGQWIVTNPSGESYIISSDKFNSRYDTTEVTGVFSAKGYCKAIKNPIGVDIEIFASWGEPQYGDENCFLADTCDQNGNNLGGEPYIIESAAFYETYKKIES